MSDLLVGIARRLGMALMVLPLAAACSGSTEPEPAPKPPAPQQQTEVVRTLFVLERQKDDLDELAYAVNNPASPDWTAYQPISAIAATYGASQLTQLALRNYLIAELGKKTVDSSELEFDVTGTIASILLSEEGVTKLFGGIRFGSADNPTVAPPIPTELTGVVTHIIGGFDVWWTESDKNRFFRKSAKRQVTGPSEGETLATWPAWAMASGEAPMCVGIGPESTCNNVFTNPGPANAYRSFHPSQLRTAYGVPDNLRGTGRSAVVLEWGGSVVATDIESYAAGVGSSFTANNLIQVYLDGAKGEISGPEATLDVETIVGMAPDIDRITLINGYGATNGLWATYLPLVYAAALDASKTGGTLADVISVSWGECETAWLTSTEGTFDTVTAALEPILMTAAAAGVTVSLAAGDTGSTGCASMSPPFAENGGGLSVGYPSGSAWTTAVGGTHLVLNQAHFSTKESEFI